MELSRGDRKELIKEMLYGEYRHDHERIIDDIYNMQVETQSLKLELTQQNFNNKRNLSIDQKVADEIKLLSELVAEARVYLKSYTVMPCESSRLDSASINWLEKTKDIKGD